MKNILLTLIFFSPLAFAESKVLELTCKSAFPFQISYDFDTKKGTINYLENLDLLKKNSASAGDGLNKLFPYGVKAIKKLKKEGDYYVIVLGNVLTRQNDIYINRNNLYFYADIFLGSRNNIQGVCKKGIHELPENQI